VGGYCRSCPLKGPELGSSWCSTETIDDHRQPGGARIAGRRWTHPFTIIGVSLEMPSFSSLTRRILFFNLTALVVLVGGILYLNQFREGLIDARVEKSF